LLWGAGQRTQHKAKELADATNGGFAVSGLSNFLKDFAIYDLVLVLVSFAAIGLSILGILIY
jgi:hypothetical protein